MFIEEEKYKLEDNNFNKVKSIKNKIILGHTGISDMRHFIGWSLRYNSYYKKTASYTISKLGIIYKHFDSMYSSEYFGNSSLNKDTILILLENDGWLEYVGNNDIFINWCGDIYLDKSNIFIKKWRGYTYWAEYNEKQIDSLLWLVNTLCEKHNIIKNVACDNTYIDNIHDMNGIFYKSNINTKYTDISPAFDFDYFKNNIENTL